MNFLVLKMKYHISTPVTTLRNTIKLIYQIIQNWNVNKNYKNINFTQIL